MKYFAYGSNMLEERLKSSDRVPDATFLARGNVRGYRLRFHKKSNDESGKCNIVKTDFTKDIVCGVVFEFPEAQLDALDKAEGVGYGYHRDYDIPVWLTDDKDIRMLAYVADSDAIDDALIPYIWYHKLVIAGAEQHRLPEEYIADLQAVPYAEDPEPNRPTKRNAEAALSAYYGKTRT